MPIATAALEVNPYGRIRKPVPPSTPELAALLECPLFAGTDPATLHSLSLACSIKQVSRSSTLAAEGSLPGQAFLVLRGRVRAVRRGEGGREITLEVFRAGDLIADALLAPEQPLANDWETVEPAALLVIPRDALLGHLRQLPEVALALGRILVARLNRSKDLAVGLAL